MKHSIKTLLLLLGLGLMSWARADVTSSSTSDSASTSTATSAATGSNSGTNTNTINFPSAPANSTHKETVEYKGSYTMKSAPALYAPPLVATMTDTCMGSTSIGASFLGYGLNGGTTWTDKNCVHRLDSREFRAMGLNDVAIALLCQTKDNQAAVEATGRSCPGMTRLPDSPPIAGLGTEPAAWIASTPTPTKPVAHAADPVPPTTDPLAPFKYKP